MKNLFLLSIPMFLFCQCYDKDAIKIDWKNSNWKGKLLSEKPLNVAEYPITMKLFLDKHSIVGNYSYNSIRKPISLKGKLINKRSIELIEYTTNNKPNAIFKAKLDNGIFYGTWTEIATKKKLYFYIVQNDFKSKQKKLKTYKYSGSYKGNGAWHQSLYIFPYSDEKVIFYFDINRGSPSYNMGSISGLLNIITGKAEFNINDDITECNINFQFKKNTIKVDQPFSYTNICGFGGSVTASGDYKLVNNSLANYFIDINSDSISFPVMEMVYE